MFCGSLFATKRHFPEKENLALTVPDNSGLSALFILFGFSIGKPRRNVLPRQGQDISKVEIAKMSRSPVGTQCMVFPASQDAME